MITGDIRMTVNGSESYDIKFYKNKKHNTEKLKRINAAIIELSNLVVESVLLVESFYKKEAANNGK